MAKITITVEESLLVALMEFARYEIERGEFSCAEIAHAESAVGQIEQAIALARNNSITVIDGATAAKKSEPYLLRSQNRDIPENKDGTTAAEKAVAHAEKRRNAELEQKAYALDRKLWKLG